MPEQTTGIHEKRVGTTGCSTTPGSASDSQTEPQAVDAAVTPEGVEAVAMGSFETDSPGKSGQSAKWSAGSQTGETGKYTLTVEGKPVYPQEKTASACELCTLEEPCGRCLGRDKPRYIVDSGSFSPVLEKIRVKIDLNLKREEEADEAFKKTLKRHYTENCDKCGKLHCDCLCTSEPDVMVCSVCQEHNSGVECHNEACWNGIKDKAAMFTYSDVNVLRTALKKAFWDYSFHAHQVFPNEVPGWIYTKMRTNIQYNSWASDRLNNLFSGTFKTFGMRLNENERKEYQKLYSEVGAMDQSKLGGTEVEGDIPQMRLTLQLARQAVVNATTTAIKSESVAMKLSEIEKNLEGEVDG